MSTFRNGGYDKNNFWLIAGLESVRLFGVLCEKGECCDKQVFHEHTTLAILHQRPLLFELLFLFFLKKIGGHESFLWGHWYPCFGLLVTSPLGFKRQRHRCYITHSLRFTSGATPANLLAASMAAEPSLPHTCEAFGGLETGTYHATTHSVRSGRRSTDWAIPARLTMWSSGFFWT